MNLSLIEALLATAQREAEECGTEYLLEDGVVYPEEIFNAQGFLPFIARMAERKLMGTLTTTDISCGFSYIPDRTATFYECLVAAPPGSGVLDDGLRLAALDEAAREVLGMGKPGIIDITPAFEFYRVMPKDQRSKLHQVEDKELKQWPLYNQLQPLQAA